jgi:predicted enzyme involved in methoxymalonyl-ACP biosynthesis
MKHAMLTLDYFALSKEAKALKISSAAKVIRIALLADCATQHLATIMRAIAARNGVQAELYEGNYDGVDLEILDPNSALYAFAPQYVVILLSSEKLKARLYASGDRRTFADETVGRLENLWGAFRAHSQATIVQSTFVLPSERAFGNYELKVADSVGSIFPRSTIAWRSRRARLRTCS